MSSLWRWSAVRMQMVGLMCMGMAVHALLRGVFGMALVCIVPSINATVHLEVNARISLTFAQNELQVDWKLREVSAMHMFFYAGTFMSAFVAHYFTLKFGEKRIIGWGIVVGSVATALVPLMVYATKDYVFTSLLRFITGLAQGFYIPCCSLLISKWFGQHERSTAMALFTIGNQVGLSLAMFLTAELCRVDLISGWPLAFALYGVLGLLFVALWVPGAANHPKESTRITAVELAHIRDSTVSVMVPHMTPFRKLLLSPVVLAICASSFCQSFVMVAMTSYLPEFHRSALNLSLGQNALWSALPFLIQILSKIAFGVAADLATKHLDPTLVCKLGNSIASFGCALCLLGIAWVEDTVPKLLLLSAGMALTSGYVPGYFTSIVCIAPPYTAAISAYAQGFAQGANILAPIIVGFMTKESSLTEWIDVFRMLSVVLLVTGVIFVMFGSASAQRWSLYTAPDSHSHPESTAASKVEFTKHPLQLIEEDSRDE